MMIWQNTYMSIIYMTHIRDRYMIIYLHIVYLYWLWIYDTHMCVPYMSNSKQDHMCESYVLSHIWLSYMCIICLISSYTCNHMSAIICVHHMCVSYIWSSYTCNHMSVNHMSVVICTKSYVCVICVYHMSVSQMSDYWYHHIHVIIYLQSYVWIICVCHISDHHIPAIICLFIICL